MRPCSYYSALGAVLSYLILSSSPTHAKTFFVDCESGNNTNPGDSPDLAKRGLYAVVGPRGAAQTAQTGDEILIRRGTICNFSTAQAIPSGVHITSTATYYKSTPNDPWPVLSSYKTWEAGWTRLENNIWRHSFPWSGRTESASYVRFSALGIANAGVSQERSELLRQPKDYFYAGGQSTANPPSVEIYSEADPAATYGKVYFSATAILEFTSHGAGAQPSGVKVDFITFSHANIAIALTALDSHFDGGLIENIRCEDVHRCLAIVGDGKPGDTLANFTFRDSQISGASGPAIQVGAVDRLVGVKLTRLTIADTGASESFGGIYTIDANRSVHAHDTTAQDFQIIDNELRRCLSGPRYAADGACIENDSGTLSVLASHNRIYDSHECFHSNTGGVPGYSPPPSQGVYFIDNLCEDVDKLGSTSDSRGDGDALLYVTGNRVVRGGLDQISPQIPERDALFNIENARAVRIVVANNQLELKPAHAGQGYGIVAIDAMRDGDPLFVYANPLSGLFKGEYVDVRGRARRQVRPP